MIRAEAWATRQSLTIFSLLLLLFVAAMVANCHRRPLAYNEIFTLYVSRLPSSTDIWHALLKGADNHAPLGYLITHFVMRVFGESELSVRIPSIVAVAGGLACLFRFTCRSLGKMEALIVIAITIVALWPQNYHLNARPYGILLGICGGMLLSWQVATQGNQRRLALAVLAILSVMAPLLHYYGFLLALPIAGAEISRTYNERRFNIGVWAAIASIALPFPLLLPFMRGARIYAPGFWAFARWGHLSLLITYGRLLATVILCLLLAVLLSLLLLVVVGRPPRRAQIDKGETHSEPVYSAGVILVSSPLLIYVLALVLTHASASQYSLQAIFGAAILIAAVSRRCLLFRWSLIAALVPCLCAQLWDTASGTDNLSMPPILSFLARPVPYKYRWRATVSTIRASGLQLAAASRRAALPVVIPSASRYLRTAYYTRSFADADRFVYLSDPEVALSIINFDTEEIALRRLAPFANLKVLPYHEFMRTHHQFLLAVMEPQSSEQRFLWLPTQLARDNAKFQLLDEGHPELLLVTTQAQVP